MLGNDKRMADLALMGEVQEQLTPEMVAAYWGTSSFFKKIIHGIRNFLVGLIEGPYVFQQKLNSGKSRRISYPLVTL